MDPLRNFTTTVQAAAVMGVWAHWGGAKEIRPTFQSQPTGTVPAVPPELIIWDGETSGV